MTTEKTVIFVSGDPGGTAALVPVIKRWHGPKVVLAYRQAVELLNREGIEAIALGDDAASFAAAGEWLGKTQARMLVGATSVNGVNWEHWFFQAAAKSGVPSLSVLDYWGNYTPRFSLVAPLDSLPDAIAIMDERAKNEMVAEGFPPERLIITGQPVLDQARQWRSSVTPAMRDQFRQNLGVARNELACLFISQPLREMSLATGNDHGQGDEFEGFERLVAALTVSSIEPKVLLVKTHPREDPHKFDELILGLPFRVTIVDPKWQRWEVCVAADLLFGVNSMLLEEARELNCPVSYIRRGKAVAIEAPQSASQASQPPALELATERIIAHITAA